MGNFNQLKSEVEFSSCTNVNFATHKSDKEQIINLIILDKSGSMNRLREAAIDGFNETVASIRKAQEKYAETQEHYVTLLIFCNCSRRFIYENTPIAEVKHLTDKEYIPCCGTPLYDAMGLGISRLRNKIEGLKNCTVIATIITDGYENSSKEYNQRSIAQLVKEQTERGWIFNYMGTNQDVTAVAENLNIRNFRSFENSISGYRENMDDCRGASENFYDAMHYFAFHGGAFRPEATILDKEEIRKKWSTNFFQEAEKRDKERQDSQSDSTSNT